jgi:hypothetical protein
MSEANVEQVQGKRVAAGSQVVCWQVISVLGFILWIPITIYLLLFASMSSVHDMVHPLRHAFSFVLCH